MGSPERSNKAADNSFMETSKLVSLESIAEHQNRKLQKAKMVKRQESYKINLKTLDVQQAKALELMQKSDSVRMAIQRDLRPGSMRRKSLIADQQDRSPAKRL